MKIVFIIFFYCVFLFNNMHYSKFGQSMITKFNDLKQTLNKHNFYYGYGFKCCNIIVEHDQNRYRLIELMKKTESIDADAKVDPSTVDNKNQLETLEILNQYNNKFKLNINESELDTVINEIKKKHSNLNETIINKFKENWKNLLNNPFISSNTNLLLNFTINYLFNDIYTDTLFENPYIITNTITKRRWGDEYVSLTLVKEVFRGYFKSLEKKLSIRIVKNFISSSILSINPFLLFNKNRPLKFIKFSTACGFQLPEIFQSLPSSGKLYLKLFVCPGVMIDLGSIKLLINFIIIIGLGNYGYIKIEIGKDINNGIDFFIKFFFNTILFILSCFRFLSRLFFNYYVETKEPPKDKQSTLLKSLDKLKSVNIIEDFLSITFVNGKNMNNMTASQTMLFNQNQTWLENFPDEEINQNLKKIPFIEI